MQIRNSYSHIKSETQKSNLKMLDCFCGMGGVSDGFAMEGFDVTGIDIVDAPKMLGYKHKFIQADMLSLNGKDYRGYDVIWGSPPCRDFVNMSDWHWKDKKNPQRGLELVKCFLKFIIDAEPTFWIMENVQWLPRYFTFLKPRQLSLVSFPKMKRVFYGNFPTALIPQANRPLCKDIGKAFDEMRQWERAKIPLACSRAFAKACKEKL